jgi:hypothetical protein
MSLFFFFNNVWSLNSRASSLLGRCSTFEPLRQPPHHVFNLTFSLRETHWEHVFMSVIKHVATLHQHDLLF